MLKQIINAPQSQKKKIIYRKEVNEVENKNLKAFIKAKFSFLKKIKSWKPLKIDQQKETKKGQKLSTSKIFKVKH